MMMLALLQTAMRSGGRHAEKRSFEDVAALVLAIAPPESKNIFCKSETLRLIFWAFSTIMSQDIDGFTGRI